MATFSRVTPTGWLQGDNSSGYSRVAPTGWFQQVAASVTVLFRRTLSNRIGSRNV